MKKLIFLIIIICLFLPGCMVSYGGARLQTDNEMILKIKSADKTSCKLVISTQDSESFDQAVQEIMDVLSEWGL